MLVKSSNCFHKAYKVLGILARTVRRTITTEYEVILETAGNIGVITLNRPKALNSLTLRMVREIYTQLQTWDFDPAVKMIMMKGSGDRAFCAGRDMTTVFHAHKYQDMKSADDLFREAYQLINLIDTMRTPCLSFIDGTTMGIGIGMTVTGAYRVCTEETLCAMPGVCIGFFPDASGSYFLPRLPGKLGTFLALTGHRLQGYDVLQAGIATHFVEKSSLHQLELALLKLNNPSLANIDRTLLEFQQKCEKDYKKHSILNPVMGKINTVFEADNVESITDALQKEGSDWSRKQLEDLNKLPPTSLRVIQEVLNRGANMTLQDCLKMEYRIYYKFIRNSDFYEGVTAVLMNKIKKPAWKPATLAEVTADMVDSYFEYLPAEEELRF